MKIIITILVLLSLSGFALADEIILKNQDRISGVIVQENNEVIIVETEAMGRINIKKELVQTVKAKGKMEVREDEKPKLWDKKISAGYNKTSGNTQNSQSSLNIYLNRKTQDDEFTIKGDTYYSSSNREMDAQKWYGMIRYAFSFGERKWYNFYKLEGDHDRFADINYRLIPAAGLGYWLYDTSSLKAMVEGALGLEHTDFRDDTKDSDEAIFVGRGFLEKKIFGDSSILQDAYFYPSISEAGEYRAHSETSFINPINDMLSLKISLTLDYDSHPPKDTKKTDTRFTTSLQYSF
ncbi:MAG: DUF481 domain-containing protein [Candidatus Omnitrophica bacterium]|nr:DUF481 domain-containing protein [Candidatus Omnitrophota bacterium]